jgi:hypothetical protein
VFSLSFPLNIKHAPTCWLLEWLLIKCTSSPFLPGFVLRDEASSPSSPFKPATLPFVNRLLLLQAPSVSRGATAWKIARGNHPLPTQTSTQPRIHSNLRQHGPLSGLGFYCLGAAPGHASSKARSRNGRTHPKGRSRSGRPYREAIFVLEGIERLDGTPFVRVAGPTFDRHG